MAQFRDPFDVVISFDTTGSMYRCLDRVKTKMREMMKKLQWKIGDIQMGVIAHGDYDTDHTYIIKYENLTKSVDKLCNFVKSAERTGRGEIHRNLDEAYELALWYSRVRMFWRPNSSRTLIMIGDCRPHEKNYDLNEQHIDWQEEIKQLREMDVRICAIQCDNRSYAESFYQKIASSTFGHYEQLTDFNKIEEILLSICFREAGLGKPVTAPMFMQKYLTTMQPKPITVRGIKTTESSSAPFSAETDDSSDESDSDDWTQAMVCPKCKVGKPPNEFPLTTVSDKCQHAPLECLRCVVSVAKETGKCPNIDCNIESDPSVVKLFVAKLDRMFVDYSKIYEQQQELLRQSGNFISVSTINGDTVWLDYSADLTIGDLKEKLQTKSDFQTTHLKLIYNDQNLKTSARLSDYNIGPNSNISMIVPLYSVPEHLDHVVFDLSWEFPALNPDFLDATCFALEKEEFVQVIDWTHSTNTYYLHDSIKHSEKNMTGPGARTGHQTIHVYLKKVPNTITHLYFTLSSWRSPNLSAFKNPSLKFYEASSENINLCETTIGHALSSQAVIMCSAVRERSRWQIFECSVRSLVEGNAKRYNPIRARIAELIRQGL